MDGEAQDKPFECRLCSNAASLPCECCLKQLVTDASKTYQEIAGDEDLVAAIPRLDKDPRLDLALVMGASLLKLSGLRPRTSETSQSLFQGVDPSQFLQAVLILDTQLKETPGDTELRLLLVQLYLLLGCASYAYQLWTPLDVKRTIQDSLSPLFFDRISTMSPGLFQGARALMGPLRTFYEYTLRDKSPLKIWDAFSAGSYTSILDMTEFDGNLRRSCTMMMTLVEERRATRCYGGKIDVEIEHHILTGEFLFLLLMPPADRRRKYRRQHRLRQPDRLRAVPQPRELARGADPRIPASRPGPFCQSSPSFPLSSSI